ncbi:MAG: HlyD family efflux transporter periplasmic adaptor subunit [Planctomycetia bacterium]|nr:HlyD family efflux transporter periplasmic adaptor subunit [Planctomycetia bacterium]
MHLGFLRSWMGRVAVSGSMFAVLALVAGCSDNDAASTESALEHSAAKAAFLFEITQPGQVESAKNVEVRCQVQARGGAGTTIISLIPEGTVISKDEEKGTLYIQKEDGTIEENPVLCKMDSSAFENELRQQQIVVSNSEATVIQAKSAHEAAKIALQEYLEGTFKQEEQLIEAEVFVAQENLRRAQDYAEYSAKLARRGYITPVQLEADEFAVEKAEKDLETARTKLRVLTNYTKTKMVKQLESDISSTAAQLRATEKSHDLELTKLKDIEKQIANCTIMAPSPGEVVYAIERDWRGNVEANIAEGVQIREKQTLFRIPDPASMRVKARVNESRISLVREKMPATIRLDADRNNVLRGTVTRVDSYPIPNRMGGNVTEYGVYVAIDGSPPGLRPGQNAEVSILVDERAGVIRLPVQAVMEHGDRFFCAVKEGGRYVPREVAVQAASDEFVALEEFKDVTDAAGTRKVGVKEGELYVQNPRKFIKDTDLPKVERKQKDAQQVYGRGALAGGANGNGQNGNGGNVGAGRGALAGGDQGANGAGTTGGGAGAPGGGGPGGGAGRRGGGRGGFDFAAADKDKDGKLSREEAPQLEDNFAEMDANSDGGVDQQEMRTFFQRRFGGGRRAGGGEGASSGPGT